MFGFFLNFFNFIFRRQPVMPPGQSTYTFANTKGQRVSVQIDTSQPIQEIVNQLNLAAGDISWRVSAEGRAEYIVAANNNCPMMRRS